MRSHQKFGFRAEENIHSTSEKKICLGEEGSVWNFIYLCETKIYVEINRSVSDLTDLCWLKQIFVEPAISYQIGPGIMPTQACAGPFRPRVVDRSHRKGKTRRRRRRFCCELSTIGAEKATKPFVKWRIQPIDGYFPWTVSRSVGQIVVLLLGCYLT